MPEKPIQYTDKFAGIKIHVLSANSLRVAQLYDKLTKDPKYEVVCLLCNPERSFTNLQAEFSRDKDDKLIRLFHFVLEKDIIEEPKTHVKITSEGKTWNTQIYINGIRVSRVVKIIVDVESGHDKLPTVTVKFIPDKIDIEGDFIDVKMDKKESS